MKKGNLAAALADANAAIQAEPNCAEAYRCRAQIHEKRGDSPEAKQDLARAKQLEARKRPRHDGIIRPTPIQEPCDEPSYQTVGYASA